MSCSELLYVVSNGLGWTAFVGLAWAAGDRDRTSHLWYWGLVVGVLLCLGRWPGLFYQREFNIDESQMIAQAIKYWTAPIPWLHVDGTTSGPVNSYWLLGPALFGVPAGYVSARMMGLACVWIFLWFNILIARARAGLRSALFISMPFVAFFAFIREREFIHYSSEHVPLALLSVQVYFCDRVIRTEDGGSARDRWILALISGVIPFTKLQATPIALGVLAVAVAHDVIRASRESNGAWSRWRGAIGMLRPYVVGAPLAVGLILGPVVVAGALRDFWISYVRLGSVYGSEAEAGERIIIFVQLVRSMPMFAWFAGTMLGFSAVLILRGWLQRSSGMRSHFEFAILTVVVLVATLFAVLRAGRPYPHYLLLFFLPVFGVVIAAAGMVGRAAWRMLSLGAVACLGVVAVVLLSRQGPVGSWVGSWICGTQLQWRASVLSEPARVVVGLARSGDSMTVWGWEPSLYVQTGLPLGTRDSLTYGIMTPGRYQAYYLNRYATDLRKGRPRFFLDVVRNGAFAFRDRSSLGHERFPQIDEIVRSDYTFAGEFGRPGDGYRLYVLKESTPP